MQLIIRKNKVIAIYEDYQDIASQYPNDECILWDGELNSVGLPGDILDPRTKEQRARAYKDKRRVEYAPIQEQLDMIYHDMINYTETWINHITAIKTKYPKSGEVKK